MTNTQVSYWNYMENRRSNKANQREVKRHNLASESLSERSLAETSRSNLAKEALTREAQSEQRRSNLANESREYSKHLETARSNRAREANDLLSISVAGKQAATSAYLASETARANRARERETNRSNISNEEIKRSLGNVEAAETNRHNRATERNQILTSGVGSASNVLGRVIPSILRR